MNIFVSYSHTDKRWFDRVRVHLKPLEREGHLDVWADDRIRAGSDGASEIRSAIDSADAAILLVSADFLASEFIASNELPPLLLEAERSACRILVVIVGPCLFLKTKSLQKFQAINSPNRPLMSMGKSEAEEVLCKLATELSESVPRKAPKNVMLSKSKKFVSPPGSEDFIAGIGLAEWDAAHAAALRILMSTETDGKNKIFESLFRYKNCPDDDDRYWGAMQTLECCVEVAPWLIDHEHLSELASHKNFSVRSVAASICMELANSAPARVPLDIVMKLSVYDEDWYVERPATAAIKAMADAFPAVLGIFYNRLKSTLQEERSRAAADLKDIAEKEPGLLKRDLLRSEFRRMQKIGDVVTASDLEIALERLKGVAPKSSWKYGL